MSGQEKKSPQQIGPKSALRMIFEGSAIKRIERIARASRARDLLASLGVAVQGMSAADKESFMELCALVRAEHVAACEDEHAQQEVESVQGLVLEALAEVQKLTETNKRLTLLAARLQAEHDARSAEQEPHHSPSPWRRLLSMAQKQPQSQE